MIFQKLFFTLHLFDAAGDGGGVGEGAQTGEYEDDEISEDEDMTDESEGDADLEEADKDALFEELIKGEYKDQYTKRTQELINKRYAKAKESERKYSELIPVLDILNDRYKTNDTKSLIAAINADDGLLSERAAEKGMTEEGYREYLRMSKQSQREEDERKEAAVSENLRKLEARAVEVQAVYPSFNFDTEWQNPSFRTLTQSGVDMQEAYEMVHHKENLVNAVVTAKTKAKQEAARNIEVRGRRPRENGTGKGNAGVASFDMNTLTKEQRADISARVLRGEALSADRIRELYSK